MSPGSAPKGDVQQSGRVQLSDAACGGIATTVTVFIRRDFGANALGRRGLAAFLLLMATVGFGAPRTRAIMQPYLVAWLIALVLQRLRNG